MKETCKNCKYWKKLNTESYCSCIDFHKNVYSSNEDEPGMIYTSGDFGCIFFLLYDEKLEKLLKEIKENYAINTIFIDKFGRIQIKDCGTNVSIFYTDYGKIFVMAPFNDTQNNDYLCDTLIFSLLKYYNNSYTGKHDE